jgi:hypothetical protein
MAMWVMEVVWAAACQGPLPGRCAADVAGVHLDDLAAAELHLADAFVM